MAITQATCVYTVKSITDVMLNGILMKAVNGHIANDTGTTKLNFGSKGLPVKTGISVVGAVDHTFLMASGQGTLPAVGDTINVVIG